MRWSIANEAYSAELAIIVSYYILTEIYSLKRYDVNFHTQISSSQSEEQTIHFKSEKEKEKNKNIKNNDTSNQNRERCFFTSEKNDTSHQKPQRRVGFAPKFPPFLRQCCLQCPRLIICELLGRHSGQKVR